MLLTNSWIRYIIHRAILQKRRPTKSGIANVHILIGLSVCSCCPEGIVPDKLLYDKLRQLKNVRCDKLDGMLPLK
jgi:hypothetical protein